MTSRTADQAMTQEVLALLDGADSATTRARSLGELARLGVQSRGSTGPRGTLWVAAVNELPQQARIESLTSSLRDALEPAVQADAANAIGEWGGAESVAALARALDASPDQDVRDAAIIALGTIGGPEATAGLLFALQRTERAADALSVLDAIEGLLSGGRADDTEASGALQAPPPDLPVAQHSLADDVRRALEVFSRRDVSPDPLAIARSKARDLLSLYDPLSPDIDTGFSDAQLRALRAEIDRPVADDKVDDGCAEPADLALYAAIPDALTGAARDTLEAHVQSCPDCARSIDELRAAAGTGQTSDFDAVLPIAIAHEAASLLSSIRLAPDSQVVRATGVFAAIEVSVTRQPHEFLITASCRALRNAPVDWSRIWLGVAGTAVDIEPCSPPNLDASGQARCTFDIKGGAPKALEASLVSVELAVNESALEVSDVDPAKLPEPALHTSGPCIVTFDYLAGHTLDIVVKTADQRFRRATAFLEFRGPDDRLLDLTGVTGEPLPMRLELDLEGDGIYYGQWMARVAIPEGTHLRVAVVPRRTE